MFDAQNIAKNDKERMRIMETTRIALIPAYEPDAKLAVLVRAMAERRFHVVIVDDGSGDAYERVFADAEPFGTVLRHAINRGKGAAIKTALAWIEDHFTGQYTVVTLDADGQHLPEDAARVCEAAETEPDALILGSRRFQNAPLRNRTGNAITRWVFRLSTGVRVYDTQTGLRAFSEKIIPALRAVQGERYEYEMNVLMCWAQDKRPIREIPIETVYIDGNTHSHFHVLRDSFRIYKEILKFSAASLASFAVDYSLYCILSALTGTVALSNVLARIVSGSVNYTLNRKLVFESKAGVGRSLIQYAALACGILALNTMLLWLLASFLGVNRYLAKLLVEAVLFVLSYFVQKRWIFRKKNVFPVIDHQDKQKIHPQKGREAIL